MTAPLQHSQRASVKLCVDCAFYKAGTGTRWDECLSPQNAVNGLDYVRGEEPTRIWNYCAAARRNDCGPDAKWFSPASESERPSRAVGAGKVAA